MYISISELKTHAYEEELKAIIENDETIALTAIAVAIEFVKTKLAKDYNIELIFSQNTQQRSPLLIKIIKDIAIWEIIGLSNPSIDYEDKKFRYLQAVDWLNAVYKGMPAGLPLKDDEQGKGVSSFSYHSNPPRKPDY